jgi:hypothetical protein
VKNTIVVVSTNHEMQRVTRERIGQLRRAGAQYVEQVGCSDVALARCLSLTGACNALRLLNQPDNLESFDRAPFDMILMVDDDMQFDVDQAQELVNHARAHVVPASAAYATLNGTLAASPIDEGLHARQLWKVGLGLVAIPATLLLALEQRSPRFELQNGIFSGFTSSAARADGQWWSEDFTLSERLGGVHLLPIAVGHLKTIPIFPDEETINSIRNGVPLPKRLSAEELDRIEGVQRVARNPSGSRG